MKVGEVEGEEGAEIRQALWRQGKSSLSGRRGYSPLLFQLLKNPLEEGSTVNRRLSRSLLSKSSDFQSYSFLGAEARVLRKIRILFSSSFPPCLFGPYFLLVVPFSTGWSQVSCHWHSSIDMIFHMCPLWNIHRGSHSLQLKNIRWALFTPFLLPWKTFLIDQVPRGFILFQQSR